jgi:prefoldin beta subunit
MALDKASQEKLQELQMGEQNLQNFLLQKQAFQAGLNETSSALEEIKKSKGDIYKITGQIMLKTTKKDIEKELKEKKQVLELRIKSIEKQEKIFREKLDKLRQDLQEKLQNKKQ